MLPERVRRWAQDTLPARVTSYEPVPGGITDTIWRVGLEHGAPVVLRWVEPDRFGPEGREFIRREAIGCRLTAHSAVPSPALIASDTDGSASGGWANLTTFRPGRVRLEPLTAAAITGLARVAVLVHEVPVPDADRPPDFAFWGEDEPAVPEWAARPAVWEAALALAAGPGPATGAGLIHRDFHPGNTLWEHDVVTGLIDWAETSCGPPDLDVAHACSNFAMLDSVAAAERFRTAYLSAGGRLDSESGAWRYWAVRDILGFLPDPAPIVVALTRQRSDLRVDAVRRRLEDLLAHVLR